MKIGVVFPQTEFGHDPTAVRDYAQAVEEMGYSHIVAYDHVLGANPDRPGGWSGPYTYQSSFLEPFVLFSYMAAFTQRVGFLTGVLILPQRETALVAKQAATLDVLCDGRLRFGAGIGWNKVEYIGLNQDFHTRGRRIEEQVRLLRRLWSEPLVTFNGEWHTIPDAGINPLPVQRPIPIWFGGRAEAVLRRIARMGDGWVLNQRPPEEAAPSIERLASFLADEGRTIEEIGLEARVPFGEGDPGKWSTLFEGWRTLGMTHLSVNTMGVGLATPEAHLSALETFAREMGVQ